MKPNGLRIALIIMIVIAAVAGYFMITGKYGSIEQAYNVLTNASEPASEVSVAMPANANDVVPADPEKGTTSAQSDGSQGVCFSPTPEPGQTNHLGQDMKCEPAIVITASVEISHNEFHPVWDYLEYGEQTDLGFHPEFTDALFVFDNGDFHIAYRLPLEPAQVRALIEVFPDYVTYKKAGYKVNANVGRGEVFSINWVEDALGNIVWTPKMTKGPRELNAYELWAIDYAKAKGYDFLINEWFDTFPECAAPGSAVPGKEIYCSTPEWSPAEEYARSQALFNFVQDPKNNVFVQIWGAVDARYQWIDRDSGKVLKQVDKDADLWEMPESGWIALQIGHGGTYEAPESWETTMTMKIRPGFVLGIDQAGYIFESGPSGWVLTDEHYNAIRTREWSQDKIMDLLGDPAKVE